MAEIIDQYLSRIGVPEAAAQALVLPVLAALLIAAARWAVLRIAARRDRNRGRERVWRRTTLYIAVVVAGLAFNSIWRSSLEQLAALIAAGSGLVEADVELWLNAALSLFFSTAALVLTVLLVRSLHHALVVRIRAWAIRAREIRFQRLTLATPQRVREGLAGALKLVFYALLAAAIAFYALFVLSAYPATAELGGQLLQAIAAAALGVGAAIVDYLPNLTYLVVILLATRYGLKLLRFVLDAAGNRDITLPGFEPEWAEPTYKLLRLILILFTVMVSYPYLPGSQSEFFRGFSLFVGALITLGSTSVIGNMISGVVLTYSGAFRVGDRVRIGAVRGDVVEKTLFVTRLRSIENEIVSIPNAVVLSGSVINYNRVSRRDGLVLTVRVGIGYDVPWRQVHELLIAAGEQTEGIVKTPPPTVWQISLDDYAVTYELRAMTDRPKLMGAVSSQMQANVLDRFHQAGVEIMTPAVRSVRDGSAIAIPAENDPPAGSVTKLRVEIENAAAAWRTRPGADAKPEHEPDREPPQR